MSKNIIAIGGYNLYNDKFHCIIEYILHQVNKKKPKVCILPTASGDHFAVLKEHYYLFQHHDCTVDYLGVFDLDTSDIRSFLLSQDIIYVPGGNTKNMLALWREWNIDKYLREAWDKGIVLAGNSAGAVCWFNECLTDSIPDAYTRLTCLGLLPYSSSPHYITQKGRREAYTSAIKNGMIIPGYAIEDDVAIHFSDTKVKSILSIDEQSFAYYVNVEDGAVVENVLPIDINFSEEIEELNDIIAS